MVIRRHIFSAVGFLMFRCRVLQFVTLSKTSEKRLTFLKSSCYLFCASASQGLNMDPTTSWPIRTPFRCCPWSSEQSRKCSFLSFSEKLSSPFHKGGYRHKKYIYSLFPFIPSWPLSSSWFSCSPVSYLESITTITVLQIYYAKNSPHSMPLFLYSDFFSSRYWLRRFRMFLQLFLKHPSLSSSTPRSSLLFIHGPKTAITKNLPCATDTYTNLKVIRTSTTLRLQRHGENPRRTKTPDFEEALHSLQ